MLGPARPGPARLSRRSGAYCAVRSVRILASVRGGGTGVGMDHVDLDLVRRSPQPWTVSIRWPCWRRPSYSRQRPRPRPGGRPCELDEQCGRGRSDQRGTYHRVHRLRRPTPRAARAAHPGGHRLWQPGPTPPGHAAGGLSHSDPGPPDRPSPRASRKHALTPAGHGGRHRRRSRQRRGRRGARDERRRAGDAAPRYEGLSRRGPSGAGAGAGAGPGPGPGRGTRRQPPPAPPPRPRTGATTGWSSPRGTRRRPCGPGLPA